MAVVPDTRVMMPPRLFVGLFWKRVVSAAGERVTVSAWSRPAALPNAITQHSLAPIPHIVESAAMIRYDDGGRRQNKQRAPRPSSAQVPGSGTGVKSMVSVGALAPLSREPKRRIDVPCPSDSLIKIHPAFWEGVFSQPCTSPIRVAVEAKV